MSSKLSIIDRKIKQIQSDLAQAISDRDKERSRKTFKCSCGCMHAIADCTVIQTHWYTRPHGCSGGDYWNAGELRVVCMYSQTRNRILFRSLYEVPWEKRSDYEFNAEKQFKDMYKHLFKNVVDDFGEEEKTGTYAWINNYYFDENHSKFGIKIKDLHDLPNMR